MRPSRSVTMRSAYCAILSSCVTSTMVWLKSRANEQIISITSVLVLESRLPVGSSANTDLRIVCRESAGDADALLLTARHLGRIMVHAFAKADPLEHGTRDRLAFTLRHALEHQWHGHILDGIEIGQQIVRLEHEAKVLLPEFPPAAVRPSLLMGTPANTHTTFSWFFHAGKLIAAGWIYRIRTRHRYSRSALAEWRD